MSVMRSVYCRAILPLVLSLSLPLLSGEGDGTSDQENINELLRQWINTKRQVTVKELGGSLSFSGEVRSEFQGTKEVKSGVEQRGPNSPTEIPSQGFDVEADLLVDYRAPRTWASIKLKFDNDAGTISGTKNKIALDRAYFGARALDRDTYTFDIEIGRRKFNNVFDSKIEFDSLFDGILFKLDLTFEDFGDFFFHAGPFLIDENMDQYGYVGEIALLNIGNTGLYTKYSLIDWDTKNFPNSAGSSVQALQNKADRRRFSFINSQLIIGYVMTPDWLKKMLRPYIAGLINHAAEPHKVTHGFRANCAWYAGFTIGEARKKGDWSFDINYQWVQAQAVPDFDSSGIKRGNAARVGTYTINLDGTVTPSAGLTNVNNTVGGANFKGINLEGFYLFTNNLSIFLSWQQSVTLNHEIGPGMFYRQFETEFIYAF